jgi:hypothetical protein
VHPRYGTPHVAIGIMVVWSLLLLFGTRGDLACLRGVRGLIRAGRRERVLLRRKRPDAERPYKAFGYRSCRRCLSSFRRGTVSAFVAAPKHAGFRDGALLPLASWHSG